MRTVVSASRRTDLPAFYMAWLEQRFRDGVAQVPNPVVRDRSYCVSLRPEDVHTVVLWSKDFAPFLKSPLAADCRYNWYFNFSLVDCLEWEPGVPPVEVRLGQMREIVRRWSPRHLNWRFDPIVFWEGGRRSNLESFRPLCDSLAELGVTRCTFSFATWYNKIRKRPDVESKYVYDPTTAEKLERLQALVEYARERGMTLESCCNDSLLAVAGVRKGSCINGPLLAELAGEPCSHARDVSQRPQCGCTRSQDIGSYLMGCAHNCLYCYANPAEAGRR
jgi:hypothetical protein